MTPRLLARIALLLTSLLLTLSCLSSGPLDLSAAGVTPTIVSVSPSPRYVSPTKQQLTVTGTNFARNVRLSVGSASGVHSTYFTWTVTVPNPTTLSLRARNPGSSQSNTLSVAFLAIPIPDAPTHLQLSQITNGLGLTWTATAQTTRYVINRAVSSTGASVVFYAPGNVFKDAPLVEGTSYSYTVRSQNAAGTSAPSNEASATVGGGTPTPAPSAPTNVAASAGDARVQLAWLASYSATSYSVKRGTVSGGPYTTIASPTTVSYSDTSVVNSTPYYYVVTATNSTGTSSNSSQVTATPMAAAPAAPTAPTSFTVTIVSTSALTLNWTDATANATTYTLERCAGSGCSGFAVVSAAISGGARTYADTSLTAGTLYRYRLKAVNSSGSSSYTTIAEATVPLPPPPPPPPPPQPVPSAPTSLAASAGDAQVQLTWAASSGATSYLVKRGTVSGTYTTVATTTTTSYLNTGLTNAIQYFFVVAAVNGSGTSANSSEVNATPVSAAPALPTTPSSLAAAIISTSQLDLSWVDASANAATYTLERCAGSGCSSFAVVSATINASLRIYHDTALTAGTLYRYRLKAVNATGSSGYTSTVQATVPSPPPPPVTPPNAPTAVTATAGDGQLTVAWTNSATATTYSVKRGTSSGGPFTIVATAVSPFTNVGLTNGTTYYYVVTASNSGGESPNSNVASATPVSPPLNTYYVATTGNDARSCATARTITTPKLTLNSAVACLSAGDTLLVRGGIYAETLINSVPGGTSWVNKVRIAAYPSETVWMRPTSGTWVVFFDGYQSYIEFDGINMDARGSQSSPVVTIGNSHHLRFQNAEIIGSPNAGGCANLCGGESNEYNRLVIHGGSENRGYCGTDCSNYGWYTGGSNNIFENNEIYDTVLAAIQIYGPGGAGLNNVIRNNLIHDIVRSGDGVVGRLWGIILASGAGNQVYNNVIYGSGIGSPGSSAAVYVYAGSGQKIWYNTLADSTWGGVYVDASASGTEIRDNVSYGNTAGSGDYANVGTGTVQDHNLFGVNPVFVGGTDFHLQVSSPARTIGVTIPTISQTDKDGVPRPSMPDVGAYQYVP